LCLWRKRSSDNTQGLPELFHRYDRADDLADLEWITDATEQALEQTQLGSSLLPLFLRKDGPKRIRKDK
jgi:hypothetical protein